MSDSTTATTPTPDFDTHPVRGRFNAAFFGLIAPYLEWHLRQHKQRTFTQLPREVVELGSGVGANLRFLPDGATLIAIEPNPYMHHRLRTAAERAGVHLELRLRPGEDTGLADNSVDAVISSLVLCTVDDPARVLAEVRRVLRPGGTFHFVEHVAAPADTPTRTVQRVLRRPWAWVFEGCSCERDLERVVRAAGFSRVVIDRYRLRTPFLPFNPHIAGIATA